MFWLWLGIGVVVGIVISAVIFIAWITSWDWLG